MACGRHSPPPCFPSLHAIRSHLQKKTPKNEKRSEDTDMEENKKKTKLPEEGLEEGLGGAERS